MKKMISVLVGMVLSLQIGGSFSPYAFSAGDTQKEKLFTVSPAELTLTEGEISKLTVTVAPEYADAAFVHLFPGTNKTLVEQDGTVTAYCCGEDYVYIEVSVPDEQSDTGVRILSDTVKVHVQPDETLPAEIRSELDRLQAQSPFGDFQRKTMELLGVLDENAPRITMEQVSEILQEISSPAELFDKLNAIHGYPDYIWRGDPTNYVYWLDDKGNKSIALQHDTALFFGETCDDGTTKGTSLLYPPDMPFEPVHGLTEVSDRTYIFYHQLPHDDRNPVRGDANNDGVCNKADAVTVKKWLLAPQTSHTPPNQKTAANADLNGDGSISAVDLSLLKRMLIETA